MPDETAPAPTFGEWLKANSHPNSHRAWSPDEERLLLDRRGAGLPWAQIAKLHGRSVASVQQRHTIAKRRGA